MIENYESKQYTWALFIGHDLMMLTQNIDLRIQPPPIKREDFERGNPFVGIVLTVNEFNYYIPMSSPKKSDYIDYENRIIRNDTKTIIRIHNGDHLYGTLRISNMIPVPITELEPYILSNENDLKYRDLILGELRYINS